MTGKYIKLVGKNTASEHYELWINGKPTAYNPNNWRTLNGVLNYCKRVNFELTNKGVY